MTNLPLLCADCHEIWEPHPLGNLRVCPGLYRDCFVFVFTVFFTWCQRGYFKEVAQVWTQTKRGVRQKSKAYIKIGGGDKFQKRKKAHWHYLLPHFRIIGVEENTFPGYLHSTHTPIPQTGSNNQSSGKRNW